jgi:hypothetical protein
VFGEPLASNGLPLCSLLQECLFGEPLVSNGLPLCSLLRERVFGEPLVSKGLPFWIRYSGFQASCYNILNQPNITSFHIISVVYYKTLRAQSVEWYVYGTIDEFQGSEMKMGLSNGSSLQASA